MKTLINLDTGILKEYKKYRNVNPDWDVGSYLNTFYDLNTAVALSKLYFPDFVDIQNCVILDMRYDEDVFNQWYKEFKGNISQVEKMCNLYELKDFFHINDTLGNEIEKKKMIETLGTVLKTSWGISLEKLYPEKSFKVDVFEDYGSSFITLYSI